MSCQSHFSFKNLDFTRIHDSMLKPAFAFDGRLILDHKKLLDIGFQVEAIGKIINGNEPPFTGILPRQSGLKSGN